VITEAPGIATDLLATAASSVATALASSEPLTVGDVTRDLEPLEIGQAVLARFTGPLTGDLVIIVDGELTTALADTSLGELQLADALAPTFAAVSAAIGPIVLGQLQEMDARLALARVFANADALGVALMGSAAPRAAVAIGLEAQQPAATPVPASNGRSAIQDVSAQRLDLLRGVEMDATAELGRTRMTVNDLLSLRTGAVIELDRAAGAAADLFVNGRLIARGEVVVIDENYGLRITQVVTDDSGR
jgi:flagellar motor switch protein FliN